MGRRKAVIPALGFHRHTGQFYVKIAGHFHYLGMDRAAAEVEHRKLVAQMLLAESGGPAPGERDPSARHELLSVAGALVLYLRHVGHRCHDPRQLNRIKAACLAARQHYGEKPVGDFDQLALQAIREVLLKTKSRRVKERPGVEAPLLSRNYVNHLIGCLQAAWTWLESQKYAPPGSAAALRTVLALRKHDGGREVKRSVAVEQWVVDETLSYCNFVVRAMVELGRLTGMRPGEVCAMRRADISCAAGEKLEVPETNPPMMVSAVEVEGVTVWVYVPEMHKTMWRGKRRLVPLGPKAQELLTPFLAGRKADAYLFSPKEAMDAFHRARREAALRETQSVPLRRERKRPPGPRYTTQSYERSINAAVIKANKSRARERLEKGLTEEQLPVIPEWTPNLLRKAAATLSDELADRDTTSALLGHATPDMAAIYAHSAFKRAASFVAANG